MGAIALFDIDSKIPNLALMKLSRYHKELGDTVSLYDPLWSSTYDKIYASKIFNFSSDALLTEQMIVGGTGHDLKVELPEEIERLQPDYSLYGYPHAIGFTMRGCRFACKFCVVPRKEGRPKSNSTIKEIWDQRGSEDSNFIVLLDNDFFGNPEWRERIREIQDLELRVNFSQGLNIRIITEEQAQALSSVNFRGLSGKTRRVHFAWDLFNKKQEQLIDAGIKRCLDAGIKPYQMTFYVLVGFNTSSEEDLYRVEKLRGYGVDPYVMPYNRGDLYQKKFARWVNHKAIFKSVEWKDYI